MLNKIQIISSHQAEFSYPAFMIDFRTNIYIIYRSKIYMAPTYSYEKQQVKLFLLKSFLLDKFNLKVNSYMSSQVGLIYIFCCLY